MIQRLFNVKSIYEDDKDILLFWQKKIFKYLYITLLVIGIFPYLTSLSYAIRSSRWDLILIFSIVYLLAVVIAFVERIPFKARVWAGVGMFYLMGVVSILNAGFVSSARLYLLCFSAFAAIFLNLWGGIFCLVINILTLVFFGVILGGTSLLPVLKTGISGAQEWFVLTATFGLLSAAVTVSLGALIKALEVSGKEFRYLIKNSQDVIWKLDSEYRIVFVNSAVYSNFGYTQKEWMGRPILFFLEEKKRENLKTKLQNSEPFSMETFILHKNGEKIPVDISGTKPDQLAEKGAIYQGIIRDITEKRQRLTEKKQLEERLHQAEKLKALGLLAGSVAHDLNNILSGIATYPEVLLMDKTLDPEIEKGLTIIKESGQKASAVVGDLLTISRGSISEKEVININHILERYMEARDFTEIKTIYPGVSIEVMMEPELLNIKGSYIHIEKSIMNLVINAVEEVSKIENGKVFISTYNTYLDSLPRKKGNTAQGEYVVLSVKDNGSGISEEECKKIFDPFYTRKQMGKSGTGLGLTVVWNTVQDHNGFIDVSSTQEGTVFNMMYPATRQEASKKPDPASIEEIMGQGQRILVVDDLKHQQDIALRILKNLGYNASAVDDGHKAVAFIKQTPCDLVILDMIMAPSISGLETYRRIREIRPGQKAIIASGYAESEDVLTAQNLGAGSFVKKPYTVLDMGIAVKEELEK